MTVQKIGDIAKWHALDTSKGMDIDLPKAKRREVRIDFRTSTDTALVITTADGEEIFLTAIGAGLSSVEFIADGPCKVTATSDGDVLFYTSEYHAMHVTRDLSEVKKFTKRWDPRQRNLELEQMQFRMNENMRRMFEEQSKEADRRTTEAVASALARDRAAAQKKADDEAAALKKKADDEAAAALAK